MKFYARGSDHDPIMQNDTPPEWTQRGNWNRSFARALATCARKSLLEWPTRFGRLARLRAVRWWSTVAACGFACPQRAADITVAWRRVELLAANLFASQAQLAGCYARFVRAIIHAQRLRELARLVALERMPAVAEFAPGDHGFGGIAAGFHLVETFRGTPMRWSEPAALVALALTRAKPQHCHRVCARPASAGRAAAEVFHQRDHGAARRHHIHGSSGGHRPRRDDIERCAACVDLRAL